MLEAIAQAIMVLKHAARKIGLVLTLDLDVNEYPGCYTIVPPHLDQFIGSAATLLILNCRALQLSLKKAIRFSPINCRVYRRKTEF